MTAATIAAIGILVYPAVAAAVLVRAGKRVDVAFARDMHRVLRSRSLGRGGSGEADQSYPQGRSAQAGVERRGIPHHVAAPPAPCSKPAPSCSNPWSSQPLAGAVVPQRAAPARPPRVMIHG